jgi:hypothetical protein
VFIGIEDIDIRLPRDELFDRAEPGVLEMGNDVRTCCLCLSFANGAF